MVRSKNEVDKMDKQLDKIIEDLIDKRTKLGYSTGSLVRYIKKKYDLEQTRAFELIKLARERVGDFHYEINKKVLEDALERLESLYQTALKENKYKLALDVQKELDKINQLHIQKMEIDANINIEQPLFGPERKDDE